MALKTDDIEGAISKCVRCSEDLLDDFQLVFDDIGLELELQKLLSICFDLDIKIRLGEVQALCESCLNDLIDAFDLIQRQSTNKECSGLIPGSSNYKSKYFSSNSSLDTVDLSGEENGDLQSPKETKSTAKNYQCRINNGSSSLNKVKIDEWVALEQELEDDCSDVDTDLQYELNKTIDNKHQNEADSHVDYLDDLDTEIDFKAYKNKVLQSTFKHVCFPEGIKCALCDVAITSHDDMMNHTKQFHCVEESSYSCIVDGNCGALPTLLDLSFHLVFKHYDLDTLSIYCKCPECEKRFNNFGSYNKHSCYQEKNISRTKIDCDECGLVFSSNKRYRFHLQFHLEKRRPKACFICDKLFRDQDEFFEHVSYSHEKNLEFLCLRCDKLFTKAETFNTHQKYHKEHRFFQCNFCPKTYSNKHYFKDHMIVIHGEKSPYKCHICGKFFINQSMLNNHLKTHEKRTPIELITCNKCGFVATNEKDAECHLEKHDKTATTFVEEIVKCFVCEYCEEAYNSPDNLIKHRSLHNPNEFICTECSITFSSYKEMKIHRSPQSNCNYKDTPHFTAYKYYLCDVLSCKKFYAKLSTLNIHKKYRHENKQLKCSTCNTEFLEKSEYDFHIHDKKCLIQCQFCEKTYSTKLALGVHVARKHNSDKFACELCTYNYATKELLEKHINTMHKDFTCEICGVVLKNLRNFELHKRIVHEREKRFFCKYCKKGFFKNCDAVTHEETVHLKVKKYKCDLCPYKAGYKAAFLIHMRAHRNESQFICHLCGRSFKKKYSLKIHIKRHNNIRDFKCPYEGCEYAYTEKTNLNLHIKLKHENGGNQGPRRKQSQRFGVSRTFFNVPKTDVFVDDDDGLAIGSDEELSMPPMDEIELVQRVDNITNPTMVDGMRPSIIVQTNSTDHDYIIQECEVVEIELL